MPKGFVKSKRYEHLFRNSSSSTFYYRQFSKEKGKQFFRSTGEKESESHAYKIGLELFNEWIGKITDEQGTVNFGKFAKRYLNAKLDNPKLAKNTKLTFQNQFECSLMSSESKEGYRPRLLDAFGHLPIEKITNEVWMAWVTEIAKKRPHYRFFNARKAMLEVLNHALELGYIERVPKLELTDPEAAPPRELTREEIRKLFAAAHAVQVVGHYKHAMRPLRDERGLPVRRKHWIKLLMLIIWKQGARPGEILQYEWTMIHFDEGAHGKLHIPARITKTRRSRQVALNPAVSRILRFIRKRSPEATFLFPGDTVDTPIREYQKAWQRVCKRAGIDAQMYWFRDTFVSRKLREGVSTVFIAKYLDTSVAMIEKKYAVIGDETQERVAR